MKTKTWHALVLLILWTASAGASQDDVGEKLAAVEEAYRESLVELRYTQQVRVSPTDPAQEEELSTTGIMVSADGLMLVSGIIYEPFNQVPHGAGVRFPASVMRGEADVVQAKARFVDGSEYPAKLVGRDSGTDVAFFRVEAPGRTFRPVSFDDRTVPRVGLPVVVVSRLPHPLGPGVAVELSRVQAVVQRPEEGFLVETGAADPVGSLVCDLEGRVLGMLDAMTVPVPSTKPRNALTFVSVLRDLSKGIGRGFARPAAVFAEVVANPPEAKTVTRGWLGVEMQALTPELASHLELPVDSGLVLGYVYRESPAENAGLETGDVLFALDGKPIDVQREEDIGAFGEKVVRAGPDAQLELSYLRDGERGTAVATLAAAPKTSREASAIKAPELDLTVREVTYDYLAISNLEPGTKGVVVEEAPVAVRTNPRRVVSGDLLVRISDREVRDLDSFREVLEALRIERPEEVILFVERGRESFFFAVKPEWKEPDAG